MQTGSSVVSAFGKVPTHGDFIRHNASSPAIRKFDEWLQRALFHVKSQRGTDLDAAYDASPPFGFAFRYGGGDQQMLSGVLTPSRDTAARRYPFVVAREMGVDSRRGAASSILRPWSFLEAAVAIVEAAGQGEIAHRDIPSLADRLPDVSQGTAQRPQAQRQYLRETTLKSLVEGLWTYFEDSRKYFLFKNLLEVVEPLDGGGSKPRYGLRFPLVAGAPTCSAVFWLDVCERLSPGSFAGATLFWSVAAPGSEPPPGRAAMLVFLETPPPAAFADLVIGASSGDYVVDLEEGGGAQPAEAVLAIPGGIGRLLEDDQAGLEDFLAGLGRGMTHPPSD